MARLSWAMERSLDEIDPFIQLNSFSPLELFAF